MSAFRKRLFEKMYNMYIFLAHLVRALILSEMRLSTYSDYSLRVLIFSALAMPELVTIDSVSHAFHVSRNHLVKVVQNLGKHGYLSTRRGSGGGFSLAIKPDEIRIGSLVRKTETCLDLVECFDAERNRCRLTPVCELKGVLLRAQKAFLDVLDSYTLADLIKKQSAIKRVLGL